jgi:hypothetical protein
VYTITVPRADVGTDEVVEALREGLGPTYDVLPGRRLIRAPFSAPVPGSPDTIVVGSRGNRVWRAQVSIVRRPGRSELRISPGGLLSDLVINALGIARKTRSVLSAAPGLRQPGEAGDRRS